MAQGKSPRLKGMPVLRLRLFSPAPRGLAQGARGATAHPMRPRDNSLVAIALAGRNDLIGMGCDGRIGANWQNESLSGRWEQANVALRGDQVHTAPNAPTPKVYQSGQNTLGLQVKPGWQRPQGK